MKTFSLMTEEQLREALREHLRARCRQGILVEEMVLERGAARIDVAMLSDQLTGFEIKSDLDSPARFFNQIHAYNRVFDEIYLVCSQALCTAMEPLLPSWWGMLSAHCGERGTHIALHRSASPNQQRDPMSLALLLRRDELLSAHERAFQTPSPPRANKWQLQDRLAAQLSLLELSEVVLTALKSRHSTSNHAW